MTGSVSRPTHRSLSLSEVTHADQLGQDSPQLPSTEVRASWSFVKYAPTETRHHHPSPKSESLCHTAGSHLDSVRHRSGSHLGFDLAREGGLVGEIR